MDLDMLFRVLAQKKETKVIFGQFKDAYDKGASRQLVGQIASGKQPLSYFASPKLFWVLSGDECSLDINDPQSPKYLMLQGAGAPKREVYSPILGLILTQTLKQINRRGFLPTHVSIDEIYTLYVKDLNIAIATGRENGISIWAGIQSIEMLVEAYGKELANVITETFGNVITGRARKETAKMFEMLFGKSMHKRVSTQYNREDNPQSISSQSEALLPEGDIVQFGSNEMAGILAEERKGQLPIKIFRDTPVIDIRAREKYKTYELPDYVSMEDKAFEIVMEKNYDKIFEEVRNLLIEEHNKLFMPTNNLVF
jgi:type IV secretory pathway TraG/TraD family ATPase VirD4